MSEGERERSEVNGGVADEDDDGAVSRYGGIDFDGGAARKKGGFIRAKAKLKQAIMFPFAAAAAAAAAKPSKKRQTRSQRTQPSCFPRSGKFRVGGGGGRGGGGRGGGGGGGFCCGVTQPRTLESSAADYKTCDPNHPTFTYEMLKALIQNNHFYSKECNPHSI